MIFNEVLSRMFPFRDLDFGKIRPNFQCAVYAAWPNPTVSILTHRNFLFQSKLKDIS